MKNALRLLAIAALATVFALPAYAQDPAATPASGPCTTEAEAKAALYKKFLDNYKGTPEQQKTASDTGKEYMGKFGTCPDEADKKVATFIQNWVNKYDKVAEEFAFTKAVNENPAQAFVLARALTSKDPDNLKVYLQLVVAGLKNAQTGNKSLNADTLAAARRALQLIEQGKTSDLWAPYPSQPEAAPGLNYHIGFFTLESAPAEAATHLLKAAQSNSSYAKEPTTYDFLALAYYNGEYKPMAAEYQAKYAGKEETPESVALYNKVNAVTDRIIDAYARAVALSKPGDKAQADRRSKLATFYKQRHDGKEDGMNELIAGILAKPIMLPGQEPKPAPPADATGANGTGGATAPATQPAATQPTAGATAKPASTTTSAPAAKPAPTPKPPRTRS
jgi:hypothetical protein